MSTFDKEEEEEDDDVTGSCSVLILIKLATYTWQRKKSKTKVSFPGRRVRGGTCAAKFFRSSKIFHLYLVSSASSFFFLSFFFFRNEGVLSPFFFFFSFLGDPPGTSFVGEPSLLLRDEMLSPLSAERIPSFASSPFTAVSPGKRWKTNQYLPANTKSTFP